MIWREKGSPATGTVTEGSEWGRLGSRKESCLVEVYDDAKQEAGRRPVGLKRPAVDARLSGRRHTTGDRGVISASNVETAMMATIVLN